MQKRIAISLLLLLFLSQAGYHFYYAFEREQLRREMKEQLLAELPESPLELIIQEEHTINWEDSGKEFYLDGRLYDVAKVKKINGKIFLYCLADKKEDGLVQDMAKLVRSGSDANNSDAAGKHSIKFQLADYIIHSTEKIIYSTGNAHQQYSDFDAALFSSIQEVNAPPPRA